LPSDTTLRLHNSGTVTRCESADLQVHASERQYKQHNTIELAVVYYYLSFIRQIPIFLETVSKILLFTQNFAKKNGSLIFANSEIIDEKKRRLNT